MVFLLSANWAWEPGFSCTDCKKSTGDSFSAAFCYRAAVEAGCVQTIIHESRSRNALEVAPIPADENPKAALHPGDSAAFAGYGSIWKHSTRKVLSREALTLPGGIAGSSCGMD
jgi:hypothetical protein